MDTKVCEETEMLENVEEIIDTVEVKDYASIDKKDLVRLCKEKDSIIESYETERENIHAHYNTEIKNMNEYYAKKVKELSSLVRYYERKTKLVIDLLNVEKDELVQKGDK